MWCLPSLPAWTKGDHAYTRHAVAQDEVGTFPNRVAYEIMKEDLGAPPEEIFEFLYPDPIASASIGQVRSEEPLPSLDCCSFSRVLASGRALGLMLPCFDRFDAVSLVYGA